MQKLRKGVVQNKRRGKKQEPDHIGPCGLGHDFGFSYQWRVLNGFTFSKDCWGAVWRMESKQASVRDSSQNARIGAQLLGPL